MIAYILYALVLAFLSVYSFVLVDPNITFLSTDLWTQFRELAVQIGYYQRELSWTIFLILTMILFGFHWYITFKAPKKFNPVYLAIMIGSILVFSYPLISHDLFNYMFDAKILTEYGQNPYLHRALDYPNDTWLRFMHWTHRTYPYGPVFLMLTLVPAFLSFGIFLLHYLLIKATIAVCYVMGVYFLSRIKKEYGLFFATQPLVIWEGLVAGHNDLIAVSLTIAGIYFIMQKREQILGRILLVASAGIKYMTLPFIILSRNNKWQQQYLALAGILAILGYLTFFQEIQPWYFLNLLPLLVYFRTVIERLQIFFLGLILSNYPFIRLGGWGEPEHLVIKHWIIAIAFVLNLIYFGVRAVQEQRSSANVA